jgi:hypothetical protein
LSVVHENGRLDIHSLPSLELLFTSSNVANGTTLLSNELTSAPIIANTTTAAAAVTALSNSSAGLKERKEMGASSTSFFVGDTTVEAQQPHVVELTIQSIDNSGLPFLFVLLGMIILSLSLSLSLISFFSCSFSFFFQTPEIFSFIER